MALLDADPRTSLSLIFEQAFSDPNIKTTPLFNKRLNITTSAHCLDAKKSFRQFLGSQTANKPKFNKKKKSEIWFHSTLISSLRGCENAKNKSKHENQSVSEQTPDLVENETDQSNYKLALRLINQKLFEFHGINWIE